VLQAGVMSTSALIDTPFTISPNPNTLYMTAKIKGVLNKVRFTIDKRQGLSAILGDVGLGKSTIMRYLYAEYLSREDVTSTLIPTPVFNSEFALLKHICQDFGLPARASLAKQLEDLNGFLLDEYEQGRVVVLFVDEAQKLTSKMLELMRGLLNYETNVHKLIQIVIAGQLELRDRLLSDKYKALYRRIIAPSLLDALTLQEVAGMLEYRCNLADISNPFTPEAIERLYTNTGGIPGFVIKVCQTAFAFAGGDAIDADLIEDAVLETTLKSGSE
jgi:general secretion pathway protein A